MEAALIGKIILAVIGLVGTVYGFARFLVSQLIELMKRDLDNIMDDLNYIKREFAEFKSMAGYGAEEVIDELHVQLEKMQSSCNINCVHTIREIKQIVDTLKDIHEVRDENGLPLFYRPRNYNRYMEKTAEGIKDIMVVLQQVVRLLDQLLQNKK